MKKINIALMAFALVVGISCKENEKENVDEVTIESENTDNMDSSEDEMSSRNELVIPMQSKSGSNVTGSIAFVQTGDVVEMRANLTGLTPGAHAIHIHENGDCDTMDASSAGGHWNPKGMDHGDWGEGAYHMGDIGNLEAKEDGTSVFTFSTDQWCLDCDDDTKNIVGKGVIVHAVADDFTSQPSGAAGARVACGVIE